jgi:hypothetical protein
MNKEHSTQLFEEIAARAKYDRRQYCSLSVVSVLLLAAAVIMPPETQRPHAVPEPERSPEQESIVIIEEGEPIPEGEATTFIRRESHTDRVEPAASLGGLTSYLIHGPSIGP